MESRDWSFVPQDIGLALLGWLIAGIGTWILVIDTEWAAWGALPALVGGLLGFMSLWHLGWRLAFPDGFTVSGVVTGTTLLALPFVILAIAALGLATLAD